MQISLENVIKELYLVGAIKFGSFILKNGALSPIYIDLRLIISSPALLTAVTEAMWNKISACQFDVICGVPYTALPIATCMSLFHNLPMILRRKEKKAYGTKQMIEGKFTPRQTCLLIEDVITSGGSILETAGDCNNAGLVTKDVVVFIDREQGGKDKLQQQKFKVHAAVTLTEVLTTLKRSGALSVNEEKIVVELLHERASEAVS
jgi:orotate phosphoribosyltransferase